MINKKKLLITSMKNKIVVPDNASNKFQKDVFIKYLEEFRNYSI